MSTLILLSGIPGTGKSTFARFLHEKHGFGHCDVDWMFQTDKALAAVFQRSRAEFAKTLLETNPKGAVIDYGFPPEYAWVVEELRKAGARLVWFAGDLVRARANFLKRGTVSEAALNVQLKKIADAGLPGSYEALQVVRAFEPDGNFRSHEDLYREIVTPPSA